jgi:hypothetical protein
VDALERDPEKWEPVFGKDHAQAKSCGPVAQGIEQQPSKLWVAGSNPAGVANDFSSLLFRGRNLLKTSVGFFWMLSLKIWHVHAMFLMEDSGATT